uniref:Uncharacterized protein n=1 Tax=viral metagenome TaxID=1070528 RepID=A0A6M3KZ86_9ZZZZ
MEAKEKENHISEIADKLASIFLELNISDQNEVFEIFRRKMVEERNKYINDLTCKGKELEDQRNYAGNSLHSIFIAELKQL